MGGGIDVEVQGVAGIPIGGAGEKFGPVGHDHLDQMVFWVNIGFHWKSLYVRARYAVLAAIPRGSSIMTGNPPYTPATGPLQGRNADGCASIRMWFTLRQTQSFTLRSEAHIQRGRC
jgi:hypothetical protein